MPPLLVLTIALALLPLPTTAERVLIQTEGPLESTHIVKNAAFISSGETILTVGSDGTAVLWKAATGREIRRFEVGKSYGSVVFSPDGNVVLIGAVLWDATTGRQIGRLETGWPGDIAAFSRDAETVLTGHSDGTARLWDTETGREILRIGGHEGPVTAVAFSPGGNTFLTASFDWEDWKWDAPRLWDAVTGSEIRRFEGHEGAVISLAFSPDGKTILTGSRDDGTARLWDVAKGREIRRLKRHEGPVTAVAFSPDGEAVLTAVGEESTQRLWDTATGYEIQRFQGNEGNNVAFGPKGKQFLSTGLTYQSLTRGNKLGSSTVTLHDLPREVWPETAPQVASRPNALGLIIGNRDYEAAPTVDYAINDAAAYKATFEEALGLDPENIFVLENTSSVDVQRWFGAQAAPEGRLHRLARFYDEVFIAYSGHGVPKVRAEGPAEGYLLPVDVPPGEPAFGGYPIGQLVAQLESVPVERITVFLDACFSGLTPAGELVPGVSGAFGVAVAPPEQEAKVSVLAATAFDSPQYAHWSPDSENGVFTRHVVAGLRGAADSDGDGALRLSELHGYVGRKVVRETLRRADREQTPSLRSDDSDQILATFGGG